MPKTKRYALPLTRYTRRAPPGAAAKNGRSIWHGLTLRLTYRTLLRRRWIKKISTITNNTPQITRIRVTLSIPVSFLTNY
ncbi:MAG: hypothetical protein JO033_05800 [Acidobacteriaceae bacterium]|nr:hypothetical protein [Acidobacteriaceae bacterium]MBV9497799.1 hypothetical protein [Acidobacteriaceae bacterium]